MSESNKAVVQKFWDCYNQAAWDKLDSLVSGDYIHHNNASQLSIEQFKRGAAWIRARMPDYHIVVEDMVAEADKVVVRWVGHGTHQGSFNGEAPTGKPVAVYGVFVHRVENNRISADWEYVDEQYIMQQIGAIAQES